MGSFKVTLDRIEESTAVMLVRDEEKVRINIPLFLLPACKERDVLDITIDKDVQETENAKLKYTHSLKQQVFLFMDCAILFSF